MRPYTLMLALLLHKTTSLPTNASADPTFDDHGSLNRSSDNSVISFESGPISFQGTRDDSIILDPPIEGYADEYAFLINKISQLLSRFPPAFVLPQTDEIAFYDASRTLIAPSTRGPPWTVTQIWSASLILLNRLVQLGCQNPVNVDIKLGRQLLTFTTTKVVKERVRGNLPAVQAGFQYAMAGFKYPEDVLNRVGFSQTLRAALQAAQSRGGDVVPSDSHYAGKVQGVKCFWYNKDAAEATVLYSEIAAALTWLVANVPAVTFSALLGRTPVDTNDRVWTPLVQVRCLKANERPANAPEDWDSGGDWSQILSSFDAQLNGTRVSNATQGTQSAATEVQIFST